MLLNFWQSGVGKNKILKLENTMVLEIPYQLFFAPTTIPSMVAVATSEEPPAETNGRVTPVIGSIPMFIPT